MSSGACRALVAVVLTLAATIVMTLPVAAQTDELSEASYPTYIVEPSDGRVRVRLDFQLTTGQAEQPATRWGPIVIENAATPRVVGDARLVNGGQDVPGPWEHIRVRIDKIDGGTNTGTFRVAYSLDARPLEAPDSPARVDASYVYLCVPGQQTDFMNTTIEGLGADWVISQSGTPMDPTDTGLEWSGRTNPADAFTCIEAVRDERLHKETVIGPADREIELQAWASDPSWLTSAEVNSIPALDEIWRFLGHDIPGEGTIIIREAPTREAGGYASVHDTLGVVQLDEGGGFTDVYHQMAHAWFGKDSIQELWLREGLADWVDASISGVACEPATSNPLELTLRDWQVVRPTAPSDFEEIIAAQEAAACGIVTALAARMPEEVFKEQVLGSILRGETKYISSAGPEAGIGTVDYREWLDAVDERGLIPAAAMDPAFADNRADLDFAQDLLDDFGIAPDPVLLARRSEARALYHDFLDTIAPLAAPHAVRKDMDDWNFDRAMERIVQSTQVYDDLVEADRLVPEAELLPIVQPQFEAAKDEAELDAVTEWSRNLVEGAREVAGPLGELSAVLPPGWTMPIAVTSALADQRFGDILPAVEPAIDVAQEVSDADGFMPQAGLLDKYQTRFETTITAAGLAELVEDARSDRFAAERAAFALNLLQNEIGDWTIPEAVTAPLAEGQLEAGLAIVEDARAVVTAAREADVALAQAADLGLIEVGLRDEVQPQFEAVTNGDEMEDLRARVEARRADAVAVGEALAALNALVPDWQIPDVIAEPVAAGDFGSVVSSAQAAQRWIENATEADASLPEMQALDRIQPDFENATSLQELEAGAALADRWAQAAVQVNLAREAVARPRDMLTDFGLWGQEFEQPLEEARQAAIAGDIDVAMGVSGQIIADINNGAASGSLRLAGIIFFGVAVVGVAGLWIMLRRQRGPSWARSTKPHWVEEDEKRGLLGRGKKQDDKKDAKKQNRGR